MGGDPETKTPLAAEEEEEGEIGDPVPNNVQAWTTLSGIAAGVMLIMGLASSEWVYAVNDCYYQGIFIYCAQGGLNDTDGSGSGSGSGSDSSEEGEPPYEEGCHKIGLDHQKYTMFVALFAAVGISCVIFGTFLALLGSWCQDIDSKRKVYRMSLYLMIVSIIGNLLSLIIYGVNFADVIEEGEALGPFEKDEVSELADWSDWSFGWSFQICVVGLLIQAAETGCIAYGLLHFPVEEVVEEEEKAAE